MIEPLDVETLRRRAPGVVRAMGTLDRETLAPVPEGLFDPAVFGDGFARIVFAEPIRHSITGETIEELPVLPPRFRPILQRDGEWVMSSLNSDYQEVLKRDGRLRRLRQIAAPTPILDVERAALTAAVEALFTALRKLLPAHPDEILFALGLHSL